MNWFIKVFNKNQWAVGEQALFSVFGANIFAVVEILPINHSLLSGKRLDEIPNYLPCKIIKYYGNENGAAEGAVHVPNVKNLYKTVKDMILNSNSGLGLKSPNYALQLLQHPNIKEVISDFKHLKGFNDISEFGNIDTYNMDGYKVQVIQGISSHKFYWTIDELKMNSIYKTPQSIFGMNGEFNTKEEAVISAKKYLDYIFPANPDEVEIKQN